MQEANKLHARIITNGIQHHEQCLRKIITFFAISIPSHINHARSIFDHIQNPSTFIYNTMIRAYSTTQNPILAINLYNQMLRQSTPPDKYTYPFLLKACSALPSLQKGQETHCQALKHALDTDIFVQNSLIHLYGSNAEMELARRIFDEMNARDVATWTTLVGCYASFGSIEGARRIFDDMPLKSVVSFSAMISGYVKRGQFKEAIRLFHELQIAKLEPNDSILTSILCACANLGDLSSGRWVHSYILEKKAHKVDSRIVTALVDMYCKCGSVKSALHVFTDAKEKCVGEWTAMISGMGMQGYGERSIGMFEEMIKSGTKPNAVTFVALLSACNHAGLVKDGLLYFKRMEPDFGIKPTVEHFGCVVDLLGRAGLIKEAMEFIKKMPLKANAAIWGALLSACRVHKNVEIGEFAAKMLIFEEPWNGAVYMALLSLYSEVGRWCDVEKVKKEMKEAGCRKSPGCSMIEVNGACHEFVACDKSHPHALEVCMNLRNLIIMEEQDQKWNFP